MDKINPKEFTAKLEKFLAKRVKMTAEQEEAENLLTVSFADVVVALNGMDGGLISVENAYEKEITGMNEEMYREFFNVFAKSRDMSALETIKCLSYFLNMCISQTVMVSRGFNTIDETGDFLLSVSPYYRVILERTSEDS